MTLAIKVSSCVDCGTPIIGDLSRCPACHDVAAHQDDASDDAVTAPRSRQRVRFANRGGSQLGSLALLVVVIEVLGIVTLAIVLLVKGCSS